MPKTMTSEDWNVFESDIYLQILEKDMTFTQSIALLMSVAARITRTMNANYETFYDNLTFNMVRSHYKAYLKRKT